MNLQTAKQYAFAPIKPMAAVQDFEVQTNVIKLNKNLNIKDQIVSSDTEFVNKLGQTFGRKAFSTVVSGSTYSLAASDYLVGITNFSYAPSIGLPRPKDVGVGKTYIIKDEAGSAGATTVTIRSAKEENIDGVATSTITTNYGTRQLYTDGFNWFTI